MKRLHASLLAGLCALSFGLASGCATSTKTAHKTKSSKVAKAKKGSNDEVNSYGNNFSLTDDHNVDERYLRRGREAMHSEALDSY